MIVIVIKTTNIEAIVTQAHCPWSLPHEVTWIAKFTLHDNTTQWYKDDFNDNADGLLARSKKGEPSYAEEGSDQIACDRLQ